ncbi:DUF4258 domain-containing protein [Thalassotalea castellviae]|uniref:DUF4258 domain-containing protein n=1 Tax=Thalassotalea castellviae TaxID=3075612 RepID=A0ABU3A2V9_9GAMM|nr:DUF4258 domain-containing protein [Thalassotalea sp. W431]MDT0604304.1 DUF4258 domain-containing protein [Thalassotalea sp. W431]
MELSKHAEVRMSQRGITNEMVNLIIRFGNAQFHEGCKIVSLNKKALKNLQVQNISQKIIDKIKALYVVYRSKKQLIVTTAFRKKRLKKDRKSFQQLMRKKEKWRRSLMQERKL